jgi:hypothetical protein
MNPCERPDPNDRKVTCGFPAWHSGRCQWDKTMSEHEALLDAVEAWWLAFRIPADLDLLALRDPFASSDPRHGCGQQPSLAPEDEGVTTGESASGRYPPGMRDSF